MFCIHCGTQLTDDSRFCYKCGTPTGIDEQANQNAVNDCDSHEPLVSPATSNPPPQQQQAKPQSPAPAKIDDGIYAIIGFVLAFFVPVVGLVFSIIGMRKKKYVNLATAGFILSIIFTIIYSIIITIAVENAQTTYPYRFFY